MTTSANGHYNKLVFRLLTLSSVLLSLSVDLDGVVVRGGSVGPREVMRFIYLFILSIY